MKTTPIAIGLFAAILALASCNSVYDAARSGEGDPEGYVSRKRTEELQRQQMENRDKIHDQSMRR